MFGMCNSPDLVFRIRVFVSTWIFRDSSAFLMFSMSCCKETSVALDNIGETEGLDVFSELS